MLLTNMEERCILPMNFSVQRKVCIAEIDWHSNQKFGTHVHQL